MMPNMPRLLIVNVPPIMSIADSLPSLAFPARCLTSPEIPESPSPHAPRTTGTIRPRSVCTATEMSALEYRRILSPIQLALTSETFLSDSADALTTKSFTEIFPPPSDWSAPLSDFRMSISRSIRTSTLR